MAVAAHPEDRRQPAVPGGHDRRLPHLGRGRGRRQQPDRDARRRAEHHAGNADRGRAQSLLDAARDRGDARPAAAGQRGGRAGPAGRVRPVAVLYEGGVADVSETLDALERKLRDLERELGAPATSGPVPPPPAAGRPLAPPPGGAEDLARQIDELARFREQLQRVGRELEAEYERVLARLGHDVEMPEPAPSPEPAPEPEPPPAPPPAAPPPTAPASVIVLDAGPFSDLAALGSFEQAVAGIAGVSGVDITGFEGRRAIAEVRVAGETRLLDELRDALPHAFLRATAAHDQLVVDLEGPA